MCFSSKLNINYSQITAHKPLDVHPDRLMVRQTDEWTDG